MALPPELQRRLAAAFAGQINLERALGTQRGLYENVIVTYVSNGEVMEGNDVPAWRVQELTECGPPTALNRSLRSAVNHMALFGFIFDTLSAPLSCGLIQRMHGLLMGGISPDAGCWKTHGNRVAAVATAAPDEVLVLIAGLVDAHNAHGHGLDDIAGFHVSFETIHPFSDGNGRVGRAIAFRECLRTGLAPFVVSDDSKAGYYAALDSYRAGSETELVGYIEDMQARTAMAIAPYLNDRILAGELETALGTAYPSLDDDLGFE